jgi:hypothetical protein
VVHPSQRFSNLPGGSVVASTPEPETPVASTSRGLPFDEEAKLVYGVVFSLRNLVKKLAGRWAGPVSRGVD